MIKPDLIGRRPNVIKTISLIKVKYKKINKLNKSKIKKTTLIIFGAHIHFNLAILSKGCL